MMFRPVAIATFAIMLFLSAPVEAGEKRFLDIQEIKTKGGITAWLVEDRSNPVIALQFGFIGAGSVNDPDDKQGMAQLLSNMMDEGAGDMDSQAFQKKLADHSISMGFGASRDYFSGSMKFLRREKDTAFDLLRISLSSPRFDEEPLQRMKDANIARIRSSLSDPDWIAARIMNDRAYDGHPYARNSGGTLSSLHSITAQDLHSFAKRRLGRDNLRVAIVGDLSRAEAESALDHIFSSLPDTAETTAAEDAALKNMGTTTLYEKDMPQTVITITQPGIGRSDPDWHAAQVMNFVLGGSGFGSRLMEEIREKRGLSYGVYTYLSAMRHVATLGVGTSTANENTGKVLSLIRDEWDRMAQTPITQKELDDARSYLVGSMPLSLSSTDQIASMILSLMLEDLPSTYLDGVAERFAVLTPEDISRVSKRLLDHNQFITVLVGSPGADIGAVTVQDIPNVE